MRYQSLWYSSLWEDRGKVRTNRNALIFGGAISNSTDPLVTLLRVLKDGKLGALSVNNTSLEITEYVKGIGKETCCAWVHTLLEWGLGAGVLPYKGLMGTFGQSGYVFRDFRLKQGIGFFHFVSNMVSFMANVLNML